MYHRRLLLAALLTALLAHSACASTPAPSKAAGSDSKASPSAPVGPEAALKMGMAAETVLQVMGKPASITPMNSDQGKAEIWAYERQVDERIERIDTSTPIMASVTDASGHSRMVQTGVHTEFHDVHHITKAALQLLMFNGHHVTEKTTLKETQVMD